LKIIAGLGNPGLKYENTRHNCGFAVLNILRETLGFSLWRKEHKALTSQGIYDGEKLFLLKPQTYMNLSGFSLKGFSAWYKIEPENILLIFDDMALPCGRLRFRRNGSSGGHKGMQSIIEQMGSANINRLKIGIGSSPFADYTPYVLESFTYEEKNIMSAAFKDAAEAALLWAVQGISVAMNKYNKKGGDIF
jgi:PTH1 family peptidyl-tRNA hydrolase